MKSYLVPQPPGLLNSSFRSESGGSVEENLKEELGNGSAIATTSSHEGEEYFVSLGKTALTEVMGDDDIIATCRLPPTNYVHPDQYLQREYDKLLLSVNPKTAEITRRILQRAQLPEQNSSFSNIIKNGLLPRFTQQFGVSLQFIKDNVPNTIDSIPPIVRLCVGFLSQPEALETVGLFRRSANMSIFKMLQRAVNSGELGDFKKEVELAALLLKSFLNNLEEPLLTFDVYYEILKFHTWSNHTKLSKVKILIYNHLPMNNYKLLKYIIFFLWKVQDRSCVNKMTSSNLAVIFGPTLAWPPNGQISLEAKASMHEFTKILLENHKLIFVF